MAIKKASLEVAPTGAGAKVILETMPDSLRGAHRAACNWGVYPHNGATRQVVAAEDAKDIVASDPDGYAHVVGPAPLYEIRYSSGAVDAGYATYQAAVAELRARQPGCVVGHPGDLSLGGDRTLCWASEEEARNDDGARAIASIVPEAS